MATDDKGLETLIHPKIKDSKVEVPESTARVYKRSGWKSQSSAKTSTSSDDK